MFKRYLSDHLPKQSFFLFGPRQVGKSTLLGNQKKLLLTIDLLDPQNQLDYSKDPNLLASQIEATAREGTPCQGMVLVDEIQRVPKLLDVIQLLMGKYPKLHFAMSGSSARKLRHGISNLLGGRALYRTLHPLTENELDNHFDLPWALAYGTLPKIYSCLVNKQKSLAQDLLRSYVTTYLVEEIKSESLVRNLQGFQNFLDIAAAQFSEQVNITSVGRDCGVAYSTVREFYSILEDTLIGFFLQPYLLSSRKRMSLSPKFYFFDNGVTRSILQTLKAVPSPLERGRLFEQWIVQEIYRINLYQQKDWKLFFWRTSHGAEVDLVIAHGRKIIAAIECKYKTRLSKADLTGIRSFQEVFPKIPCFIVAPITTPLKLDNIKALPPKKLYLELDRL